MAAKPATHRKPRRSYCCHPDATVDIALGQSGVEALPPVTIPEFFKRTFDKIPNGKALCWKSNKEGPWQSMTYAEYKKLIYNVAKSFLKVWYVRTFIAHNDDWFLIRAFDHPISSPEQCVCVCVFVV